MKKEQSIMGKVPKCINFDKIVLDRLEERAKKNGSSVSHLVNFLVRQAIMSDADYYRELARFHYLKFQDYNFMKDQCLIQYEVKK